MGLASGAPLGSYVVTGLIGRGGMGEVYRARDSRLNRDVALKVLPGHYAEDAQRLARFRREAQILASLNHPNIASIYGLEETGETRALVLELVEGPTLADMIAQKGALPVEEALSIASQIAEALDAAHDQGIVHRDLKPANVKVKGDGTVKVLDFGLGKMLETGEAGRAGEGAGAQQALTASPTITSPAATRIGVILGTAAYMSPEQARGRTVDKRADIWAFGCVLYEMLAGRRPFDGEDVTETIGAVIHKEPDWSALGATVPPTVRIVLERCLQKDPRQRLRDAGDVRLALAGAFDAHATAAPTSGPQRPWRRAAVSAAIVVVAGAITGAAVWSLSRPAPAVVSPVRFSVSQPLGATSGQFLVLSPDGRRLAFFATDSGTNRLWVHSFDTGETQLILRAGVVSGAPFWSPDSRLIAYTGEGSLKKIDPSGGPPEIISPMAPAFAGGTWSQDDVVVYAEAGRGLMRVSAAGGSPLPLTVVDPSRKETSHSGPWSLPDGRHFLYLRSSSEPRNTGVYVGALDAKPEEQNVTRLLASQQNALYAPSPGTAAGHLLFLRDGTLMAQPFDPVRLALVGEAVRVADQVGVGTGATAGYGHFSVSATGVLAYRRGQRASGSAVWVSRSGQEEAAITGVLDSPYNPRLSADDRKVALIAGGDLWVYDVEGRPPNKLTFGGSHFSPLWTPDGRRIAYELNNTVVVLPADGSGGTPEPMSPAKGHYHPHGWSADGREIVLVGVPGPTQTPDILKVSAETKGEPEVVVATPANEGIQGAALSPNGRWLAYASDQTGQLEIWVRPYPGPGPAVRVSPKGGVEPVWAKNGRELYYREQSRMMAVAVNVGAQFDFKPAALLFESRYVHSPQPPTYDVAADGRFVMIKLADPGVSPFNIVLNWTAGTPLAAAH